MADRRGLDLTLGALLLAAVVVVYAPITGHRFVTLDDPFLVSENAALRTGLSWQGLRWAFSSVHAANWIPLTWTSYLADETLHGRSSGGVHAMQLLLHAASTLMLYAALRRLTGQAVPSAVVAGLFGLHPLNVESVAWASERKGVLSGLFFLIAAWCYAAPRPRMAAVALSMVAALLAKPVAVTLPFVLLLLDFWPLQRITRENGSVDPSLLRSRSIEKAPLFALSLAGAAVASFAQERGGALVPVVELGLPVRLSNALIAYGDYLRTFLWPADLAVYYPHPEHFEPWRIALALVLLGSLSALAIAQWRRRPWLIVGWLWFLGTLVPMIGLVQVGSQARADRYAYLPTIGLAVAMVWSAADWAHTARRRRIAALAAIAVLATLSAATARQRALWRDGVALFGHSLQVVGSHPLLHEHLGLSLLGARRVVEGREQLERAHSLHPNLVLANNLAWSYATDPDPALRRPERSLALALGNLRSAGEMPELLDTLAAAYAASGRFGEASRTQRRAVETARAAGDAELAQVLETRRLDYAAGRVFIDTSQAWAGPAAE